MLWKTADGQVAEMSTLDSPHLIAIVRMVRNKIIVATRAALTEAGRNSLDNPAYESWAVSTALDQWDGVIREAIGILRTRKAEIPGDILPRNYPNYVRAGTPDLKVAPWKTERRAGFDPQNAAFKKKIEQLREERKPPKARTRDLLDY